MGVVDEAMFGELKEINEVSTNILRNISSISVTVNSMSYQSAEVATSSGTNDCDMLDPDSETMGWQSLT